MPKEKKRPDKITGFLYIGTNNGNVCVSGGRAALDANGDWHIIFSPDQAEGLAENLLKNAEIARNEK